MDIGSAVTVVDGVEDEKVGSDALKAFFSCGSRAIAEFAVDFFREGTVLTRVKLLDSAVDFIAKFLEEVAFSFGGHLFLKVGNCC